MRAINITKFSLVLLVVSLGVGCASVVAVSKSPQQIVIADEYGYGGIKYATNEAMEHCNQYGAGAVLVTAQETNQQSGLYPMLIGGTVTYVASSYSTPVYTFVCDPKAEYIHFETESSQPESGASDF